MSPLEVWTRQSQGLKRLRSYMLPQLFGGRDELAREVKVRSHYIEFQDAEIDPDTIKFEGAVKDVTDHKVLLREGETYRAFINPLAAGLLHICDAAGRYLGAALRVHKVSRVNREDVYRAIGMEAGRQTERMLGYRTRHAGDVTEHQEMLAHNAAVLSGAPVTDAEKAEERARKRAIAAADPAELLDESERSDVGEAAAVAAGGVAGEDDEADYRKLL
jgi:hypothetical protein